MLFFVEIKAIFSPKASKFYLLFQFDIIVENGVQTNDILFVAKWVLHHQLIRQINIPTRSTIFPIQHGFGFFVAIFVNLLLKGLIHLPS